MKITGPFLDPAKQGQPKPWFLRLCLPVTLPDGPVVLRACLGNKSAKINHLNQCILQTINYLRNYMGAVNKTSRLVLADSNWDALKKLRPIVIA